MSLFVDLLPGTRRAVRNTYESVQAVLRRLEALETLSRQNDDLRRQLDDTRRQVQEINARCQSLEASVSAYGSKGETLLWELYREGGESSLDMRRRFFQSLPPAQGSLRLFQLCGARLFSEFDAFCEKQQVQYWAEFGTLLGAVRHRGFVPWDDDTDVCMLRADIEKLIAATKDDPRYHISVRLDPFVICRQIRFAYADRNLPGFIDLFICDKVKDGSETEYLRRNEIRKAMVDAIVASPWWQDWYAQGCIDESSELGEKISRLMFSYVEELNNELCSCPPDDASGIIWSIDNIDPLTSTDKRVFLEREIFPTHYEAFEDAQIRCPARADVLLERHYGDYYSLPNDIDNHFRHVDDAEIHGAEKVEAMKRLLSNGNRQQG